MKTSPDVVLADMPEGGVLFDLNSKQYYSLNTSGVAVWKMLETEGDVEEIEARLRQRLAPGDPSSGADAGEDALGLRRFVARLEDEGLLAENGGGAPASSDAELPVDWMAPTVEPHGRPLSEVILSPFDPTTPIPE